MGLWAVVFVVLMILWLFCCGGACYYPHGQCPPPMLWGSFLIPWLCVAILGYIVLGGGGSTAIVR